MKFKHIFLVAMSLLLLSGCGNTTDDTTSTDDTNSTEDASTSVESSENEYAPAALDTALTYYADIDIAEYGLITIQLDQAAAPITCANFVELSENGFYDGLTFHRIMAGFMMQGGDPLGTGMGGSEHNIVGEFKANGYDNKLSHKRGVISMARAQAPNSASSQFFICHEDSVFLDGQYAAFGVVTEGLDVVDAVCESANPTDNNGSIPSDEQPVITSIKIRTE